jgi:2-keto-3-deoxy-L-rhamnonate aldolase RhmA
MTSTFKTALARGDKQVGLWLSMGQPYSAEICASTGFQWLLIDGEHTPNDLKAICEVDGAHGVFIGPADLAASMGHRGNPAIPPCRRRSTMRSARSSRAARPPAR